MNREVVALCSDCGVEIVEEQTQTLKMRYARAGAQTDIQKAKECEHKNLQLRR